MLQSIIIIIGLYTITRYLEIASRGFWWMLWALSSAIITIVLVLICLMWTVPVNLHLLD